MGSCVPRQFMSAALDPHCWNATSFADPEYVMDFKSPIAFCALAITVFASCAMALPHSTTRQIAVTASFFDTASLLLRRIPYREIGMMSSTTWWLENNLRIAPLNCIGYRRGYGARYPQWPLI